MPTSDRECRRIRRVERYENRVVWNIKRSDVKFAAMIVVNRRGPALSRDKETDVGDARVVESIC
jgi:hypothetical protein